MTNSIYKVIIIELKKTILILIKTFKSTYTL